MSNHILKPLIDSEGYCCLHGYLKLCRHRKETHKEMANNLGVARATISYNYTQMCDNRKSHRCQGKEDCMKPIWLTPPADK